MKNIFFFFFLIILTSSCSIDNIKSVFSTKKDFDKITDNHIDSTAKNKTTLDTLITTDNENEKTVPYDTLLSDNAKLIAGMPTEVYFKDITQKKVFKDHADLIDLEWYDVKESDLQPISIWTINQNITSPVDTSTVFYPFAGPDFLYAHHFFPFSKDYVLVGLENEGSIVNPSQLHDTLLTKYLYGVRYSMRFINKVGYFVTSQMNKDFAEKYLNGVSHILFFYIARSGFNIISYKHFYLNNKGTPVYISEDEYKPGKITGLSIEILDTLSQSKKTLQYFRLNLENSKMSRNGEFYTYINRKGYFNTYIKSGSYILHDRNFSAIRNYILTHSNKILQDDTGIPYSYFSGKIYDVKLYGKYSRTISDFKNHFQHKMAEDLERQNNPALPFRIGYNAWFDETLLLFAERKGTKKQPYIAQNNKNTVKNQREKQLQNNHTKKTPPTNTQKGIVFKVQFFISGEPQNLNSSFFADIPQAGYYVENGVYKYTAGITKTVKEATAIKKQIRAKGFSDAFLVAFNNGKRIPVADAAKMVK